MATTSTTATVALLVDATSTVGARVESSMEIGFLNGTGDPRALELQLLDPFAPVAVGDRLVSFGVKGGAYVPGVPLGTITAVEGTPGQLTRDRQGRAVRRRHVARPRRRHRRAAADNPRDAVLPPKPTATPAARAPRVRPGAHRRRPARRPRRPDVAWLRAALTVVLVVTAVLLELTVLPLLHLPGATPDIVTVTVIALGFVGGPVRGAATGLFAGLLVDLVPPADGVLGLSALVLVVIGYLAGLLGGDRDRSPFLTVRRRGPPRRGPRPWRSPWSAASWRTRGSRGTGCSASCSARPSTPWSWPRSSCPFVAALWRRVDPPAPRYEVGRQ